MVNNELENVIMARYACRDFNDEKVTDEEIEKIIELARFCPSACNSQPWQLLYTTDKKKMEEIKGCLQDNNHNLFLDKAKAYILLIEQKDLHIGRGKWKWQEHDFKSVSARGINCLCES